jgi:hypothetical protein
MLCTDRSRADMVCDRFLGPAVSTSRWERHLAAISAVRIIGRGKMPLLRAVLALS